MFLVGIGGAGHPAALGDPLVVNSLHGDTRHGKPHGMLPPGCEAVPCSKSRGIVTFVTVFILWALHSISIESRGIKGQFEG